MCQLWSCSLASVCPAHYHFQYSTVCSTPYWTQRVGDKTSITTVSSCDKTSYTYPIRWDMSVEESIYTEKKARSLTTLKDNSRFANKPCHKHLGSIHHPLLDIDLTKVVVDELHLLLRVTDLLTRNLISIAASRDHEEQQRLGESCNHIGQLEQAVQACKVTFTIWQRVDGDGRPQPGKYECTSLNGTDRLQVLRSLPAKFDTILPSDLAVPMAQLWNVSVPPEFIIPKKVASELAPA